MGQLVFIDDAGAQFPVVEVSDECWNTVLKGVVDGMKTGIAASMSPHGGGNCHCGGDHHHGGNHGCACRKAGER